MGAYSGQEWRLDRSYLLFMCGQWIDQQRSAWRAPRVLPLLRVSASPSASKRRSETHCRSLSFLDFFM